MAGILIKNFCKSNFSSKHLKIGQITRKYKNPIYRFYSTNVQDQSLWVRSSRPDVQPVVGKTLPEFLWENVLQWESATAFECGVTGKKYSFGEVYRNSRGFGASLIKLGIPRGSTVSVVMPNFPEYAVALFGSLEAGLVVSTTNPSYTPHEIIRQVVNSETKIAITTDMFLPTVLKARESCPDLKTIILLGQGQSPEGCLSFYEMMKRDPTGYDFLKGSEIDTTQTTAMLPYSSGTTGPPKGVELTHFSLATNVVQHSAPDVGSCESFKKGKQERLIGVLPFFHVGGFQCFLLYGFYNGCHTMTVPKFDPTMFVSTIKKHKPTVLQLVPPLVNFVSQCPDITKEDLKHVHVTVAGAAALGPSLINKFSEKLGEHAQFQEAYGMTEMSGFISVLNLSSKNSKIGSAGKALPNTICKIIDVGTGKCLGPNERGELCLKGPQLMRGYFKNDKATQETIDSDGWLHTGDICYYDEDKYFYIVDRLKELIKVNAFQVSPSELEDLLREHEDVVDVAVIGVPHKEFGEVPRAYIVSRNKQISAQQIHDFIQDKVIRYKRLVGGIEFVESIRKAPSGKILRRELLVEYKTANNITT